MASLQKKKQQQKMRLPSFLLESSQDPLVQNQDGFRQPHLQKYFRHDGFRQSHLQKYFHHNYIYHLLFKDQNLAFPASYAPEK